MRDTSNPKIKQYTDQRTGKPRYLVRYRKPDGGQTKKRGFLTKRDAEQWLTAIEGAKQRGEFVAVSAGRVPLRSIAEPWLRTKATSVKPKTHDDITSAWELHVEPHWGSVSLQAIRPSMVESWVADLDERYSPTLVRRAHSMLAQVLDLAVRDRLLQTNPARGVALPRVVERAHRYLSHVEVRDAAAAAGDFYGPLVYALSYGGTRWGEAVALLGEARDGARVRIDRAVTRTRAGWHVGTPKTHERRVIYLPGFVAEMLPDVGPKELIFPARRGEYLSSPSKRPTGQMGWWQKALHEAGIEYLPPHDLRHTAASLAVQSGASVKAVQRMLGHKSAAVTLDVYADLWDSDLVSVAASMEAARAGALGGHGMGTDDRDPTGTVGNAGVVLPLRGAAIRP